MKPKKHKFVVVVTTHSKRKEAELKILTSFAKRSPDGMEFKLLKKKP